MHHQDLIYNEKLSVQVPPLTDMEKEMVRQQLDLCDGFIIPGGAKWYEFDELVIAYALENNLPIFGVFLVMEAMANYDNKQITEISLPKSRLD